MRLTPLGSPSPEGVRDAPSNRSDVTRWLYLRPFIRELAKYVGGYVNGDLFPLVARAMSLILALSALILGIVFILVLPAEGRLTLGNGLAFVGLLLTAASFFANAGRP